MDCKKALVEAEGDMDTALEALRKKGLAQVDKKSGRAASEGTIETYIHTGTHASVEPTLARCPTAWFTRLFTHGAVYFAQAQSWA